MFLTSELNLTQCDLPTQISKTLVQGLHQAIYNSLLTNICQTRRGVKITLHDCIHSDTCKNNFFQGLTHVCAAEDISPVYGAGCHIHPAGIGRGKECNTCSKNNRFRAAVRTDQHAEKSCLASCVIWDKSLSLNLKCSNCSNTFRFNFWQHFGNTAWQHTSSYEQVHKLILPLERQRLESRKGMILNLWEFHDQSPPLTGAHRSPMLPHCQQIVPCDH